MYRLFISSLPASCSLNALRAFFSQHLASVFRIEKNKSKGRNTVYHAVLSVEDQREYEMLLSTAYTLGETPLEISRFVSRESRLSQDELVKGRKVHVSSIPPASDTSLLERAFAPFGAVEEVYIRRDKADVALYAFIIFEEKAIAEQLIQLGSAPIEGHSPCIVSNYTTKVQSTTSLGTPPTRAREAPSRQFRCQPNPYQTSAARRWPSTAAVRPFFARPAVTHYYNYDNMRAMRHFPPHLIGGYSQPMPDTHYTGRRACFLHPDSIFPSISKLENTPQVNFGASQHSIRRIVRDLTHLPENIRLNFQ